jgi:hypothetical protein
MIERSDQEVYESEVSFKSPDINKNQLKKIKNGRRKNKKCQKIQKIQGQKIQLWSNINF